MVTELNNQQMHVLQTRRKLALCAHAAVAALSIFLHGGSVFAQVAVSPQWSDGEGGADIIVTAQRRSERLQDVPITVNVVDSSKLASAGVNDMQQLNSVVPGLNIAVNVGAYTPSIRGIATQSNIVETPVAIYLDGVYLANSREGLRDLMDIEQIAVLKGPQGTLFGRNATAGVIQLTTRAPKHDPEAQVKFGFDNFSTLRSGLYLTGGLNDKVAASMSLSYASQGEGWGNSLSNGMDLYKLDHNVSLRGKLQGDFGDLKVLLTGDYMDREDAGRSYQPYPGTLLPYAGFGQVSSPYDNYSTTPGWNRFWGTGASLQVEYTGSANKFVSITSFRKGTGGFRFDLTSVATPYVVSTSHLNHKTYTQEFQLLSAKDSAIKYVGGLYLFHNAIGYPRFDRVIFQPFPASPANRLIESFTEERTTSIAPFAQFDIKLLPDTTLTLGGRMTYEKREIDGFSRTTRTNGTIVVAPATTPNSFQQTKPTWRIALAYKFSPDVSVYASYNRGLKSGGYNISSPQAPVYKNEVLDAYEIGFKSELFDRRLRFNASAFLYQYQQLQLITFLSGTSTTVLINAGEAEIYGVDGDFSAKVTDEFTLSGGFQLMHATFTDYPSAPISSPKPGGGSQVVNASATGKRLPLAQNVVGTLTADYQKIIEDWKVGLNVTGTYNGDYYFEADNFLRQPSYVHLNSSLRISDIDDKYSLTLAVTNILDEAVITNTNTQPYGYFAYYGAPRIYSATIAAKF